MICGSSFHGHGQLSRLIALSWVFSAVISGGATRFRADWVSVISDGTFDDQPKTSNNTATPDYSSDGTKHQADLVSMSSDGTSDGEPNMTNAAPTQDWAQLTFEKSVSGMSTEETALMRNEAHKRFVCKSGETSDGPFSFVDMSSDKASFNGQTLSSIQVEAFVYLDLKEQGLHGQGRGAVAPSLLDVTGHGPPNLLKARPVTQTHDLFVIIEYMDGWMTLQEYVKAYRPIPNPEVLTRFAALATSTALLHDAGYYHCDLHDRNFFVKPSDKTAVRLFDFGMARPWRSKGSKGPLSPELRACYYPGMNFRPSDILQFFRALMMLLAEDDKQQQDMRDAQLFFASNFYDYREDSFTEHLKRAPHFDTKHFRSFKAQLLSILGDRRNMEEGDGAKILRVLEALFEALSGDPGFGEGFFASDAYTVILRDALN